MQDEFWCVVVGNKSTRILRGCACLSRRVDVEYVYSAISGHVNVGEKKIKKREQKELKKKKKKESSVQKEENEKKID